MKYYLLPLLSFVLPAVTLAAEAVVPDKGTIQYIIYQIGNIIGMLLPVAIALAVVVFVFGLVKYVASKEPEKQSEAKNVIISGVVILFVIVAMWGLVNILSVTFGVGTGQEYEPPAIPGFGSEDN